MECPYDKKGCDKVNTSGMSMDVECPDCERHNDWIRPTGAIGCYNGLILSLIIWGIIIFLIIIT